MCLIYLFFDYVARRILVSPAGDWTRAPQGDPRSRLRAHPQHFFPLSDGRPRLTIDLVGSSCQSHQQCGILMSNSLALLSRSITSFSSLPGAFFPALLGPRHLAMYLTAPSPGIQRYLPSRGTSLI